jgi:hypothetical protein
MASTLSKTGITTGQTVETWHVTQSIDAFSGVEAYDIFLSGSFNMTGSINGQPGVINNLTASRAISSSFAISSSRAVSSSYALTASYALNGGGGTGNGQVVMTFSHSPWITASITPYYYATYPGTAPIATPKINTLFPYGGSTYMLTSASISGYMENPIGGGGRILFAVVKNSDTTPVSKSLTLGGATTLKTDSYYSSFEYIKNIADPSPLTINNSDTISIKMECDSNTIGVRANTVVTCIFEAI